MSTAPTSIGEEPKGKTAARPRSPIRFPNYNLADSVAVAKAIQERGGGMANNDQLAAFLGYKSPNNGAYANRVSAAKLFGLIEANGGIYRLTPRGSSVLSPTYEEDGKRALVDAFMAVPLFKAVLDEIKSNPLPPEFGMKNLFRVKFQVVPNTIDTAYRILMESAEDAGFFSTRGARTHLIMPTFTGARPPAAEEQSHQHDDDDHHPQHGGGGGGGNSGNGHGGGGGTSIDALRAEYVSTLIALLKEKGPEPDLMERIEKLLAIT